MSSTDSRVSNQQPHPSKGISKEPNTPLKRDENHQYVIFNIFLSFTFESLNLKIMSY